MAEDRIMKGIWIPIEIWKDAALSWNEKILLLEVDSFTSREQDCYFSDDYIADLLGVSRNRANILVNSLIEKGYLIKTRFDGRRRYLRSAIHFTIDEAKADIAETQEQLLRKHNTSNSNNNINSTGSNKRINKKNNITIPLPFQGAEFIDTWNTLIRQPKWKNKSEDALVASAKFLADYPEATAVKIMRNTIRNGWQGLFPPKAEDVKAQQAALVQKVGRVHASVLRQAKELGWSREDLAIRAGEEYAQEWDKYYELI